MKKAPKTPEAMFLNPTWFLQTPATELAGRHGLIHFQRFPHHPIGKVQRPRSLQSIAKAGLTQSRMELFAHFLANEHTNMLNNVSHTFNHMKIFDILSHIDVCISHARAFELVS